MLFSITFSMIFNILSTINFTTNLSHDIRHFCHSILFYSNFPPKFSLFAQIFFPFQFSSSFFSSTSSILKLLISSKQFPILQLSFLSFSIYKVFSNLNPISTFCLAIPSSSSSVPSMTSLLYNSLFLRSVLAVQEPTLN